MGLGLCRDLGLKVWSLGFLNFYKLKALGISGLGLKELLSLLQRRRRRRLLLLLLLPFPVAVVAAALSKIKDATDSGLQNQINPLWRLRWFRGQGFERLGCRGFEFGVLGLVVAAVLGQLQRLGCESGHSIL